VKAILIVLYILLGIAQITAYLKGINLWLGIGTLLGLIIFFGTAWLPFGSVIDALIGFYGAYKGWQWEWWQAALLTFPFAIVGLIISSLGWIVDLFGARGRQLRM
jgi:hypothetical protein